MSHPQAVTLETIRAARDRNGSAIYHSPCPHSLLLSRLCNCDIYCKLEQFQVTGSFKERGARNRLLQLDESQRRAGVVAASAGNHALGLAYHGQELGIPVTVVMPRAAPLVKVSNCRSFGAQVLLEADTYAQAKHRAIEIGQQTGKVFVHGFDDPAIISGQGTLGLEILQDVPDVEAVIVPVGGGGLIAGVGLAIKSLKPGVRVIGVEPVAAPTLHDSLAAGTLKCIEPRPTLADGLAIAEAGPLCFSIAQRLVDRVVLVDEVQIATAVLRLLEMEKIVAEGAGAAPLAALLSPDIRRDLNLEKKSVVLCLAGGNIDVTTISRVIEHGLAADGRLCRIVATISDRPGGLADLAAAIAASGAGIKEVEHDRQFGPRDVGQVAVSCVLETRDAQHIQEIRQVLTSRGIRHHVG